MHKVIYTTLYDFYWTAGINNLNNFIRPFERYYKLWFIVFKYCSIGLENPWNTLYSKIIIVIHYIMSIFSTAHLNKTLYDIHMSYIGIL